MFKNWKITYWNSGGGLTIKLINSSIYTLLSYDIQNSGVMLESIIAIEQVPTEFT